MNHARFQAPLTGRDDFDKQHLNLMSLLEQLAAAKNAYDANKLALGLLALWHEHHRSEERWMRSTEFAFESDHRVEHQKLDVFFENLRHLASSLPFLDELPNHAELIAAKLREHIVTYDMQFREYP